MKVENHPFYCSTEREYCIPSPTQIQTGGIGIAIDSVTVMDETVTRAVPIADSMDTSVSTETLCTVSIQNSRGLKAKRQWMTHETFRAC